MEKMPRLIYGTAWKKDDTCRLVTLALQNGFKGIDTACQPKHYHEPGVGEAVANFNRDEIFLQTKFTSFDGQDPRNCPYEKSLPLEQQIIKSFETSLKNLRTSYIDSYVLHGPLSTHEQNIRVWRQFEKFVESGQVGILGISNFYSLSDIVALYDEAVVKPKVIQNRLYAKSGFDKDIRKFCEEKGITYQSFWTLTGNPQILSHPDVEKAAESKGMTVESLFFAYLIQTGVVAPLTGTKDPLHMKQDLQALSTKLTPEQMNIFNKFIN